MPEYDGVVEPFEGEILLRYRPIEYFAVRMTADTHITWSGQEELGQEILFVVEGSSIAVPEGLRWSMTLRLGDAEQPARELNAPISVEILSDDIGQIS